MKYMQKISISITILLLSVFTFQMAYAQEFSPIGKLAQEYIERLNEDLNKNNELVPGVKQQAVVVNPESITQSAITESIETISRTVEEVRQEKEKTISEIQNIVKEDIDNSIIQIRKQVEKPAYELQRSVDSERTILFEYVTQKINEIKLTYGPDEYKNFEILKIEIENSLNKIQKDLEEESGTSVNFEKSKKNVREIIATFEQVIKDKAFIIESRQGNAVFEDKDSDGISDYDETYIYKTDPLKTRTTGEGKTDGEKISEGINPLSDSEEKIQYQDPRNDTQSFVSSTYTLKKIELLKEEKKVVFEGVALPNSYVTLFIYSTPIIVTVKTDQNGQWKYSLQKELENGEHQMYVASVDTSGKILARSNPILFTKSAEAATIGIAGSMDNSISAQNFLRDNFILIILASLIAIVILGMMFVGNHKTISSAVIELKKQVNSK